MVDADATEKFNPPHNQGGNHHRSAFDLGGSASATVAAMRIEHRTEML